MNAHNTQDIDEILDLLIHDKIDQVNELTLECREVSADIEYLIHIWELSKKLSGYKKVDTNFALHRVNILIQNN